MVWWGRAEGGRCKEVLPALGRVAVCVAPSPGCWAGLLWQDLPGMTNKVTEWKH